MLEVEPDGWGDARHEDIAQVCLSAASAFRIACDESPLEPIRVSPSVRDVPWVAFDRLEEGAVNIFLSARDRRWAQYAYQFAHEFCHVLSNFRRPRLHPTAWIEEVLCETASLFALRAMAQDWLARPPYPHWRDYAAALDAYAAERCSELAHQPPAGLAFETWLSGELPQLESDPHRRADNTKIALRLLPLFEADPAMWRAVRYLNLWQPVAFGEYFPSWRNAAPGEMRSIIDRIEGRLCGAVL